MTMLQRIENTYLAILRLVVVGASGLLLVSAIVFAIKSAPLLEDPVESTAPLKAVSPDLMIDLLTKKEPTASAQKTAKSQGGPEIDERLVTKVAEALTKFVSEQSAGSVSLKTEKVREIIRSDAQAQSTSQLKVEYLNALAATVEKALAHPSVLSLMKSPTGAGPSSADSAESSEKQHPAVRLVVDLLGKFNQAFNAAVETQARETQQAQLDHQKARLRAMTNSYTAGACFGAFLLIVFLSVFLKIERNLRSHSIQTNGGPAARSVND
ncbi:MAG: hypothetical protein ACK5DL_12685 [Burkholderiales bacterium]|nr:hypothetical protein [Betaproteobacteria bacterium]